MTSLLDPRRAINLAILFLSMVIGVLSLEIILEEYDELAIAQETLRANVIADDLIVADASIALERGLTSMALGYATKAGTPAGLLDRIAELRAKNDRIWEKIATAIASETGRDYKNPESFLRDSQAEKKRLDAARGQVDRCLSGDFPCAIRWNDWIMVASGFIVANERLRETMLGEIIKPRRIAMLNLSVKRLSWLAAEYAGRERAVIAYHVSAALPLPTPVSDSLHTWRGVVVNSLDELVAMRDRGKLEPEIAKAVTTMQRAFLEGFETSRRDVYAGAMTGNYPVSGTQWLDSATRAINSILLVSDAVSTETRASAIQAVGQSTTKFVWHIIVLAAVLLAVPFSFVRVRQTANELFNLKELAEVTLHAIEDAVITVTLDGRVGSMNPAAEILTGWREEDARGRHLDDIYRTKRQSAPRSSPAVECLAEGRAVSLSGDALLIRRDGTEVSIEDSAVPLIGRDGRLSGCMLLFYDADNAHHVPHLLSYHATHDVLTELVNRREFERRLASLVGDKRASDSQHVLCMLDLDRFKVVNDVCGHAAGDKLLRQLAYQLKGKMRKSDLLARLGGDEFGALLENCSMDHAWQIAEDLRQAVRDYGFQWEGKTFKVGVSIGMVQILPGAGDAAELMKAADAACYAAKDRGRDRIHVAEIGDASLGHKGSNWSERLQSALANGHFVLFAQEIRKLENPDDVARFEFLLRMADGENLIPPLAFLPDAERHGLMLEIDRWVISEAMRVVSAMKGTANRMFFINISAASLAADGFAAYVGECAAEHGVDPATICLELPETVALLNLERLLHLMGQLRPAGFHFGLDSFGSGFAPFFQLKGLPIDFVKLDGRLVRGLSDDPMAQTMLRSVGEICRAMGVKAVATNVESAEALALLPDAGIELASGIAVRPPEAFVGLAAFRRE